jgi:predicted ATPase/DNA-binding SARP family transcriptional activator
MDTRLRIELLGGLRIEQGSRVITRFRTQKTAALLAYLGYYRERFHPREHLIDLLWLEADLASGRNSLSIALSSLRHQLEPPGVPHGTILRADRTSVQLNPEAVNTDVAEFEATLQKAAQAGSANERLLFFANAAELYAGELLPGFYEEWCLTERQRLVGTYLGSLHQLVETLERMGDLDRALGYARRAVSADPLREEGHLAVMRLLASAGQPTAALRQYRDLEQLLDEQLGEEPSIIVRQLALEIKQQATGPTATTRQVEKATVPRPRRPSALPARLPTGTVTFLLTDLEGSTAHWEKDGEEFRTALAIHHTLLRRTFRRFGGYEVKEAGDGFIVAFERAGDALACAVAGQCALTEHSWPEAVGSLRVRMALHTGDVELQQADYHGLVLHHAFRMLAAGHGGQVLCSEATAVVVRRNLEPRTRLIDLGVYRLRDVEISERLFQVEYPEMAQRVFPPLRAETGYARNLPLQFTRFIGRERELGQVDELLLAEQTRLVTLTGPGGTGKSRLALELAGRLVEGFHGAVWFVPLAGLSDPQRIVDAVLGALRLLRSPSVEPLDQIEEVLSRQPSLLVLDNFEHLVEQGASVVQALLERLSSLKCLVTSRQVLGLSGEREFVVSPLQTPAGALGAGAHRPTPDAGVGAPPSAPLGLEQLSMYESVQLFIDRAQIVKPDFQVTNRNAAAVAELCNRLEGIPLALELAAARAQVLTPGQMLHQLAHRFEFLVSRKRDGAKRHQTLHAAMEWSYRLLQPELQRFFARLSVFRGGWTWEAAEAVCEEPLALDYLAQLRECSLVVAEEVGEETRFGMLETLREFGQEYLEASGEMPRVRQQHADFFHGLAEEAVPKLRGSEEMAWLDRLEREHDNLRSALEWLGAQGQGEAGLRLGGTLWRFWEIRGHWTEGRERLAGLLALREAEAGTAARAAALQGAGWLALRQGQYGTAQALLEERLAIHRELGNKGDIASSLSSVGIAAGLQGEYGAARALHEESLAIKRELGDKSAIAASLNNLGMVAWDQREWDAARAFYEESLAIRRELEDKGGIASSLNNLGIVAHDQGDYGKARALHEESLAINRELGDQRGIAASLYQLGDVASGEGEYGTAHTRYEESLAINRELGNKRDIAGALGSLGSVAQAQGDHGLARALFEESLAMNRELGSQRGIVSDIERLAAVALAQAQSERAARLLGAAEGLREALGAPLPAAERAEHDRAVAGVRTAAGEAAFAAAWAEGRAMTLNEAIAYALQDASPGEGK